MTEPQITEPDFIEYIQRLGESLLFADLNEKLDRFAHGQLQDIVNRFVVQFNFQHVRLKPFPFAFGAAHIEIA